MAPAITVCGCAGTGEAMGVAFELNEDAITLAFPRAVCYNHVHGLVHRIMQETAA